MEKSISDEKPLKLSLRILRCAGSARDKVEHYELVCCYHEAVNLETELDKLRNLNGKIYLS